ncbi:serine protease persephone [Drosophila santomea]|uniref:serine protease persephone n=1 Tax=Drosophila santomea TaxID=129105 RepID=UPI001954BF44|nr:serine protease persephone [Drosophila santomea]
MNSAVCLAFLWWMLANRGSAQLLDVNCAAVPTHSGDLSFNSTWMALVVLPNKTCSGVLIHKQFVITSASCIFKQGNAIVRLGQLNSDKEHGISDEYRIEEYQIHSSYIHSFYDESNMEHDIALLELENEVLYNANIRSICIWLNETEVDTQKYTSFNTARWVIDEESTQPRVLTSKIRHFTRSRCQNAFKIHLRSSHICAGYEKNIKCPGTGSPLYKSIRYNKELYTLFGIQSYGDLRKCLYTDVTSYIDWILGIVLSVDVIVPKNSHAQDS